MALAIGCGPTPATVSTQGPDRTPATDAVATEPPLRALATRIDPGPTPGLLDGIPTWAITQFGLDTASGDVAALEAALAQWRGLPDGMPLQERLGRAVNLGLVALAIERGKPDAIDDRLVMAALAQLYGTFDMPQMFDPKGLFGSMIGVVARGLVANGGASADDARAAELMSWLTTSLGRLPALHRRMVARMLREAPDHPDLPDALDRIAARSSSDPGLVVALRRNAVELRGRFATAEHHRELAMACFADLDLACGDAALADARAFAGDSGAEAAKKLAEVDARRAVAQRVLALADSREVDERLERARLLGELGRNRGAAEAFAAIHVDHPRDARAVVGEIDATLRETLDFAGAFATLEAAGRDLDHRDQKFLELSIGVRCMQLMYVVLPGAVSGGVDSALKAALPVLEPVRRDVAELAAMGVDKGVVVQFLIGIGDELLPAVRADDRAALMKRARTLLPAVLELRRKLPTSRYPYDLMLAASQLSGDPTAGLRAVGAPIPVQDAELAMRAAMTRLVLAMTVDDRPQIDAVQQQIEAWPESFGAAARTRALARVDTLLSRMDGDAAARDRAIARYETVLAQTTSASDVPDLCNLAVLLVDAGRRADAGFVLDRALALDSASEPARLHRAVLAVPVDLAALESLASAAESQVKLAALGWLVAADARPGARARWTAKRKAQLREPALRPREFPTPKGIGVESSLNVGIGYSTVKGLEIDIDAEPVPRIYVQLPKPPR